MSDTTFHLGRSLVKILHSDRIHIHGFYGEVSSTNEVSSTF